MIIVVCGATASYKTRLSVDLAKKYNKNVFACENPHNAVSNEKGNCDFLFVGGSFYLAREIIKDLL